MFTLGLNGLAICGVCHQIPTVVQVFKIVLDMCVIFSIVYIAPLPWVDFKSSRITGKGLREDLLYTVSMPVPLKTEKLPLVMQILITGIKRRDNAPYNLSPRSGKT